MLNKIKNKPVWYQIWAISVAASALYFLVKYCFFDPSPTDRFIEVYALGSLVVDYLFFSENSPAP